ncbi:MAG: FCD domain-containing protein [Burkholderiaceae bacterium]
MTDSVTLLEDQGLPLALAEKITQLIYAGEFKPGDRLNEAMLAIRVGTSRGPVREAIRILAGTGLVKAVKNRGVFVREISVAEMLEIYELRALVFSFAAERSVNNLTDRHRIQFEDLLDQMDAACLAENSDSYYGLNIQFHDLILTLSGNQRAHRVYKEYVQELHLFRRQNFDRPGNMRRSNMEHRQIYDAISKGSNLKAEAHAKAHILAGRQRLLTSSK